VARRDRDLRAVGVELASGVARVLDHGVRGAVRGLDLERLVEARHYSVALAQDRAGAAGEAHRGERRRGVAEAAEERTRRLPRVDRLGGCEPSPPLRRAEPDGASPILGAGLAAAPRARRREPGAHPDRGETAYHPPT